jgi:sirohydrochlorin cobaltochelatase
MAAMNVATDQLVADRRGTLVVGHGTREAAGIAEFHAVVEQAAARLSPLPVEPGFLELAEPTIDAGLQRLAERSVRHAVVVPLLLFAAGHAKRDIPEATAAAAGRLGLTWHQASHLGLDRRIVELSARRYDEALVGRSEVAAAETLLIVVGRGSTDSTALDEFREFARQRGAERPVGRVEVAFTAMAEPRLDDVLAAAGSLPYRRVVVQPHLLFAGELLDRVGRLTAGAAARFPNQEWLVTDRLGPHPLLVEAVTARIVEPPTSAD